MARAGNYKRKTTLNGEPVGKQRDFCEQYVADEGLNGAAAARKAGYSAATAAQKAHNLLGDPLCAAYIAKLKAARSERTKIDSDWVLLRLEEIDGMELLDIFAPDFSLKPLDQWPLSWRKYITSFELAELVDAQGDAKALAKVLKKIKGPDKLKTLELIGRHTDVGAFKDQLEVDVKQGVAERLAAAAAKIRAQRDETP